jgi:putative ABC transport system substrate-binding protein
VQFDQLKRREFITLLGGAATWPLAGRAQQPDRMRRVGVLMSYPESNSEGQSDVAAFRQGLQKLGWTEGGNIRIDTRWATPNDVESIRRFAKQLVAMKPDVILTHNTPTTASVLEQTHAIPVIFAIVVDPVGSGFVASLARPGGNATGFMNFEPSMGGISFDCTICTATSPSGSRIAPRIPTKVHPRMAQPGQKVAHAATAAV